MTQTNVPMSFQDLLARNETEIKEPLPIPVGHYRGFMSHYEQRVFNRKNVKPGESPTFSKLACYIKILEPCSDVNPADLEAYNQIGDLHQEELRYEFWLNDRGYWDIVSWLKTCCGCTPGGTVMDLLIQAQGKQGLTFEIRHEVRQDATQSNKRPYATIGDFLPFGTNI